MPPSLVLVRGSCAVPRHDTSGGGRGAVVESKTLTYSLFSQSRTLGRSVVVDDFVAVSFLALSSELFLSLKGIRT